MAATAPSLRGTWAALGFTFALVLLFTVSATYHRVHWTAEKRAWMRRADHASIFVLIAGTYTPIALVGLPNDVGNRMLIIVWCGAALGVLQTLFWIRAPKVVTALLAIACGWVVLLDWDAAVASLNAFQVRWLVAGGVVYSVGALFYATKRPNPVPGVFGYHEMFHLCTIIAGVKIGRAHV